MPTAMIGIGLAGLAWLAFGRETHDTRSRDWDGRRDWRVRSGYEFERDRQLPGDQMDYEVSARPRGAVREESRHLVQQTRQTARRAQSTLRRTWDENPFLIGAAAAVVGALVAASVPATRERKPADGRNPRQPGRRRPAGRQRQGPGGRERGDQRRVTSAAGSRPGIVRAVPRRSTGLRRGGGNATGQLPVALRCRHNRRRLPRPR